MIEMREAAYDQPRYHSAHKLFKQHGSIVVTTGDTVLMGGRYIIAASELLYAGDTLLEAGDTSMKGHVAGG